MNAPSSVPKLHDGQWLVVLGAVSGERVGFLLEEVDEVVPMARLKRMPESAPWMVGTLNLAGEAIPVVDVAARLRRAARATEPYDVILICRDQDRHIGLLLQDVTDVVGYRPELVKPVTDDMPYADYVSAVVTDQGEQTVILNAGRLIRSVSADED